jgi:glycosyltransferase involved in cell wall biosynthesis
LIEAMALVTSDVTLTLQGKNHIGEQPMERMEQLGVRDRVILLDPCPPEDIVEVAAQYDVGIVALRGADENERRAATSKLFTYIFAGLAVLGSDLPGIARVVNEHHNGVLVEGMEPAAWAAAIDRMAAMPIAELDAMKQRSLGASAQYSWERQKPLFIAEFQRALGRDPSGGAS